MLIASLILYQKLRKDIEAISFNVNTYDPCVTNKIICNKKMTINWNLYDLKVSHSDKDIVDTFIEGNKETHDNVKNLIHKEAIYMTI